MYLAEFAFIGTTELVSELLIQASCEHEAKNFALEYALNWGIELFSLTLATEKQARICQLMGQMVDLEPSKFSQR